VNHQGQRPGPMAWMARHGVAPNLLMVILLVGGFLVARGIKQEVFPDFQLDIVRVTVPYPGASPEEVERGIILSIEEAVRGLEGVKEVRAVAREGVGTVEAELFESADAQKVYQDIRQEVDRITTFPEDAEEPDVTLVARRRGVLTVELYGDVGEWALRQTAEMVRDRLLQDPGITQVDILGARNYEIHIEVPEENLRAYGLTLEGIARRVASTALELPGGKIETRGGEILLRMTERREWAKEFANIPIITTPEGSVLYLDDIATVREGFEDTDSLGTYNGVRAMGISVYRVANQTPIGVSRAVRRVMAQIEPELPPRVHYAIRRDMSDIYRQRLQLLLRNAALGLTLVMLLLGLFLEAKLAFWVGMGIPISFLGAFLFLPGLGVTINMVSMFAFIVSLGIVVDDAIVVGENVYAYRQQGMGRLEAAIHGAREVAVPVSFSILTNVVAFLPLMMVPGVMGKIWRVIPLVVVTVFTISWLEALFVLPCHLAHTRSGGRSRPGRLLHGWQQSFSAAFLRFVERYYGALIAWCVRFRYLTLAMGTAILTIVAGYVLSGRIGLILMPRVEADFSYASAVLPVGCPMSQAIAVRERLEEAARGVAAENGGADLFEGFFAVIRENRIEAYAYLTDADRRPISTARFTDLWRQRVGEIPGLESLQFASDRIGPAAGASLTVELSHRDIAVLDQASRALAARLAEFPNVRDIDDGYTPGKAQLSFTLKPEGHSLGLTVREVARQVRNAFYGAEAIRQQRGRNEIKVKVRLPEARRTSEADIENLLVRTPSGRDVPLRQVAAVHRGRAYTDITRRNGRRTVTVTANVVPIGENSKVIATLRAEVLPDLMRRFPGLGYSFEGRQAEMRESIQTIIPTFAIALMAIYALLAIPFRSYAQPLVVMMAIPFGLVGAVLGHLVMGYNLSVISLLGIVALSGVVVNDALVLIDFANRMRRSGLDATSAIRQAGIRRFRPILLTTLTTFGGLAPMIFETSVQARFLIPMALSLGYGLLFATTITLLIIPSLYMIIEDIKGLFLRAPAPTPEPTPAPSPTE